LTGPADDIEDADPGLARERTELAWHRTAVSFAAVGAAILKYNQVMGVPILALSGLIWELGRLSGAPGTARARSRRLLLITVTVTAISVAALTVTLLGSGSSGLRF